MSTEVAANAGLRPLLVGREDELAAIDAVLRAARGGTGGMLLFEGPAGIGKTSLLREARRVAVAAEMTVLHGLGSEFEREYPFGVVRQALAPHLRTSADRERLLTGTARLAGPALLDAEQDVDASPFGLLNGLYWLLAALTDERGALLIAVDDAQWADEPTLRFLGFLARRVDSLRVALVVGARTAADFSAVPVGLAEVRDHARAYGTRMETRALDAARVAQLVAGLEGQPADEEFTNACHRATGGNPFLLDELLRALRNEGVAFSKAAAERVAELSVPGVTRSVSTILERLGPDATALARAVAVLGDSATLALAAQLAGLAPETASVAAGELAYAAILEDVAELRFRHPILAGAVRDGLSARERAAAHGRAAQLLRERGDSADRLALQLLHVRPAADAHAVDELRRAARHARERGAPATAARLLGRALAEPPPPAARAELLLELGRAELDEGRLPAAEERFLQAHARTIDPLVRGHAAAMMALAVPGDPSTRGRVIEVVRATHEEVAPLDRELGLRLRSILVLEGERKDEVPPAGDTPAEAVLLGSMVFGRMDPTARAAEIADIAARGARQADALLDEGAIALAFTGIVLGLRWTDRLDEAERLLTRAIDVARRRGSTADFAMAMTLRANVRRRAGRLREAEADARSALPAELDARWGFARGVQPLTLALLDQGRVEDAFAELTAVVAADEEIIDSPPMIPVLLARMAVHAARREHARALADWHSACARAERLRGVNAGWIEDLAVAAGVQFALGDLDGARATADEAFAIAGHWGTPGSIGQALHAQARVGAVADAEEALETAVAQLARSPARLEHARALVAFGALLRRAGRRADSRRPLREGHELATGCGAEALAESARAELRASGVRVRRASRSGADALTPSERRIADMAASERSNAEIAQELFLTVKTVEMHLTHVYRKLEIGGRRELGPALAPRV